MILNTVMPLFTGEARDEEMSKRHDALTNWLQSSEFEELKVACRQIRSLAGSNKARIDVRDVEEMEVRHQTSIAAYYPGKALFIPLEDDPNAMRLIFPPNLKARVPKGLVVRLHLLYLLYELEERQKEKGVTIDPADIVFSCIDGSGAFAFSSIKLLVEAFNDPEIDVVLGRRPSDFSGMAPGRKEIEEFEQYLLFKHRTDELHSCLSSCGDLSTGLLPDGQAGCWGFRMRCVQRLPLTANGYEIEYDLLASALDAKLKINYTAPLIMPRSKDGRHSSASSDAIRMSIRKLDFIRRKLRITHEDICQAWKEFALRFDGQEIMRTIPTEYEKALSLFCSDRDANDSSLGDDDLA